MKLEARLPLTLAPLASPGAAGPQAAGFDYQEAFSRTLGWVTADELERLRQARVAIAGMGGVGGVHLQALARLGVGGFHLADLDTFELANMNRQAGASLANLGRAKVQVMAEQARQINPELELRCFEDGVHAGNLDAFLEGVDVYVDGLDFFALDVRRQVFRRARELGIPAVTAAPVGMGTAWLLFTPEGMSFEDYFQLEGLPPLRQAARFAVGLAPSALMLPYLVDPARVDLSRRKTPSTPIGCFLSAGVAAAEVLKLILSRGTLRPAPWYHHFDAYRGRWVTRRRGPLHRLRVWVAERRCARLVGGDGAEAVDATPPSAQDQLTPELRRILQLARWAPSGDNSQPWRWEPLGGDRLRLVLRDQSQEDVYDQGGRPTLLSGGTLLESLRLAASTQGRALRWEYRGGGEHRHELLLELPPAEVGPEPLAKQLVRRATDRRPFRTRALRPEERQALEAAAAPLRLEWHQGWRARARVAALSAQCFDLRFRLPEAVPTHRRVVDWQDPRSPRGVPAAAVGWGAALAGSSRLLLQSDRGLALARRLPASSWAAAARLEVLPALLCAAHVGFRLPEGADPDDPLTLLRAGACVQRFWLEATRLGLAFQPNMAPVIFSRAARRGDAFSADRASLRRAGRLAARFERLFSSPDEVVFLGRVGAPRGPLRARSGRRELNELLEPPAS